MRELKLPKEVRVISVHREGKALNVHGDLHLEEGDIYTIAGNEKVLEEISVRFESDSEDFYLGKSGDPAVEMDM